MQRFKAHDTLEDVKHLFEKLKFDIFYFQFVDIEVDQLLLQRGQFATSVTVSLFLSS